MAHTTLKHLFHFLLAVTLTANGGFLFAQSYPIHHSPNDAPVAQYQSRYPLDDVMPQGATSAPIPNASQAETAPRSMTSQAPPRTAVPQTTQPRQPAPRISQPPRTNPYQPPTQPRTTPAPTARHQASVLSKMPQPKSKAKPKEKKLPPHYGIDYSVYRDYNPIPVDPRKPCNKCVRPDGLNSPCGKGLCKFGFCSCLSKSKKPLPGIGGRPYMDTEPGACQCNKKKPNKKPDFSIYWPRPFSAKLDHRFPGKAECRYTDPGRKRITDIFDPLSTFKISSYKRKDSAFSGLCPDPYGCLGETGAAANFGGGGALGCNDCQIAGDSVYTSVIGNGYGTPLPGTEYQYQHPQNQPQPAEMNQSYPPGYIHPVDDPAVRSEGGYRLYP